MRRSLNAGRRRGLPRSKNGKPWQATLMGASVRNEALKACHRLVIRHLEAGECLPPQKLGWTTQMHGLKRLGERVIARPFERQVAQLRLGWDHLVALSTCATKPTKMKHGLNRSANVRPQHRLSDAADC